LLPSGSEIIAPERFVGPTASAISIWDPPRRAVTTTHHLSEASQRF
jgi:hypothetical protein